ncbi:MAG TPA: hypothetical protein VGT61_15290 [Thermomicrobiales bacterium]|jgi:hypothetical protein|nr:hypothetical protein [Thermomicrobiales bacterium]
MVRVDVERNHLVVRLAGWEWFWSLRREIGIPLAEVERLRPAPDLIRSRPAWLRLPGTYWPFRPGPAFAGTYFQGRVL